MKITRKWAMPSAQTFKIAPIRRLLYEYMANDGNWADPFANGNSPAEYTNDINPDMPTKYHLDAHEFANLMADLNGVLFDPPYSLEQMKRSYENIGRKFTMRDGQICNRWTELKDCLANKIRLGGYVISFGWNTQGFGKKRGFQKIEIMIVAHGSGHNDTLVTVEQKFNEDLFLKL